MNLVDIVEKACMPIKAIDDFVLRQYTKAVIVYERQGNSRYPLAFATLPFDIIGFSAMDNFFPQLAICFIVAADLFRTSDEYTHKKHLGYSDVRVLERMILSSRLSKEASPYIRFPLFAAAAGYAGKSAVDIYSAYQGEASLSEAADAFTFALGLLSLSSSMYIKDADKDILKKNPVWRKMYDKVKDTISSLYPKPTSVPVPI